MVPQLFYLMISLKLKNAELVSGDVKGGCNYTNTFFHFRDLDRFRAKITGFFNKNFLSKKMLFWKRTFFEGVLRFVRGEKPVPCGFLNF